MVDHPPETTETTIDFVISPFLDCFKSCFSFLELTLKDCYCGGCTCDLGLCAC